MGKEIRKEKAMVNFCDNKNCNKKFKLKQGNRNK